VSLTKKKKKVDHKIKILKLSRIVIFTQIVIFHGAFFVMNFLCLSMHMFSFLHYGLHSRTKVLHNKWCLVHYVCIMWKETIEIFSEPKNEECNILFNVFPMFFFWLKTCLDMCFDNLIKIYVSHHYYII